MAYDHWKSIPGDSAGYCDLHLLIHSLKDRINGTISKRWQFVGMSTNKKKNTQRSFDPIVPFLKIHRSDNCTYKHIAKYPEGCSLYYCKRKT